MQRYVTDFSFHPMTPRNAYILGLSWADGYINTPLTRFSLSSQDEELYKIRDIFYASERPLEIRAGGCRILHVNSRRIVEELVAMGFSPMESRQGKPFIPPGLEQYFLLGLLDGDGCVYSSSNKVLRVFYSGNAETMESIRDTVAEIIGIHFSLRQGSHGKDLTIDGRKLSDHRFCYVLQSPDMKQSIVYLTWLYNNTEHISFFRRNYFKFLSFQALYQPEITCPLCGSMAARNSSTGRYCPDCSVMLRRLRNRQQDHLNRTGIRQPLIALLTDTEKKRVALEVLATL
jgi:hypothetical protein